MGRHTLMRLFLLLLLTATAWCQDDSLLRLGAVTGMLRFPAPLRLPDRLRGEEAPSFVVEDYRPRSNGYSVWIQLTNFSQTLPSYCVSSCAQPLVQFRSMDASFAVPPEVVPLDPMQTFDRPVMIARANTLVHPDQGRGRWQCLMLAQALQISVPLQIRSGRNQAQLHISLRPGL